MIMQNFLTNYNIWQNSFFCKIWKYVHFIGTGILNSLEAELEKTSLETGPQVDLIQYVQLTVDSSQSVLQGRREWVRVCLCVCGRERENNPMCPANSELFSACSSG